MAGSDERERRLTRRTSVYIKDLPGMVETLRFKLRLQLMRLAAKQPVPETKEQIEWALALCDQVRERYDKKLPFPVGSVTYVMGTTWPAESEFREELIRLEKAYPSALGK